MQTNPGSRRHLRDGTARRPVLAGTALVAIAALIEALRPIDPALATDLRDRVVALVERDWHATGHFHEYFDGNTGAELGADAQTAWTVLVANLVEDGWPAG